MKGNTTRTTKRESTQISGVDKMKPKILHGTLDDKHFIISIFDDPDIIHPMEIGLKRFFEQWKTSKLKEKTKKESDSGYLSLSGSSSGCRR